MTGNHSNKLSLMGVLLLLCLPTSAYADAGTVLMWVTAFHLLIGNALIGVLEGIIIAKIFHARLRRSILIMILANYVSMSAGGYGIHLFNTRITSFASIDNLSYIILGLATASFVLTIILEWPFCFWILKGQDNMRGRSFKASLIAQTASYALLIPIYLSCSGISLMTKTNVDKSLSFLKIKNAWVYYLSPKGENLYKIRIDGSERQKVKETGIHNEYAEMFICNSDGQTNLSFHWYERKQNNFQDESKIILKNIPGATATKESCDVPSRWSREVIDFRPENHRDWDVHTGTWAKEGLSGKNQKTGKSLWIALETPFLMWPITKATILPEDQVICEIGNQIVAVDLNTNRIGLITFGSSPVVVLEK